MGRFAIKTPPQHAAWEDMRAIWRAADEIELFESAWVFDHLYPIAGDPHGSILESWVALTALAGETSRIRLGSMVNGMHFRHPAVTAKMAVTLDIISGGRMYLGLGAGWFQAEVDAYGLELGTIKQRMDRFEEGVEVIDSLLRNESTTFHGEYYHFTDARCEPKGPQTPRPPIAIGGTGEKRTLSVVARCAQWWDALGIDPAVWTEKNEVLLQHCEAAGRDPVEITRSAHVMSPSDADPRELAETAAGLFAVGVDVAVFSLRSPYSAAVVEPLAEALREL
ncbi:MAG: TIGR03560 family F420-dependent LLM class oxidoreductase [Acidimicrobiia bacterium]|nr:TIGR03560 family F420-dependent LLM class oxidoreductase [Acidimicrobiia bacterium]